MARRKISTSQAVCIITLWFVLCYLLLTYSETISAYTAFVIVASGIIVFIPLYKNRKRKDE
jgi:L-asparagine transporter-like permease